jgi:hypothetical protein
LLLTVYVGGKLFKLGQDPSKCTTVQNGGLVSISLILVMLASKSKEITKTTISLAVKTVQASQNAYGYRLY